MVVLGGVAMVGLGGVTGGTGRERSDSPLSVRVTGIVPDVAGGFLPTTPGVTAGGTDADGGSDVAGGPTIRSSF